MKKLLVILLSLILLSGCSNANHYSDISNSEVLFTGPNNYSYTTSQLYKAMKVGSADVVANNILKTIALKNNYANLEELQKEADEFVETYINMGYESYIVSYYGSIDAYKAAYVDSLIVHEMAEEYVNQNFDGLVQEHSPVKMRVASFASQEEAQKCIDDTKNGSTFDMAAANNNSQLTPEAQVYLDTDSTLVYDVKQYVNDTDTTGVSEVIPYVTTATGTDGSTSETTTYYVIDIESRNVEDFRDEFVEAVAHETSTDVVEKYFFEKHKIEYFDQDLYKMMSERMGGE